MAIRRWRDLFWLAMVVVACIPKQSAGQPSPAQSVSRWNILAEGLKGEMHGAPVCHPFAYFTSSPIRLDIDSDLYAAQPADLTEEVSVTPLGKMDGRETYEVLHRVHRSDVFHKGLKVEDASQMLTMKLLLIERAHAEFCDVYQLQYTDPVGHPRGGLHEARILAIDGREVLKTIDEDNHTWTVKYWTVDGEGPVLLNTDEIFTAIREAAPLSFQSSLRELNLQSGSLKDSTPLGTVELALSVEGDKIVARTKKWIPASNAR